MSATEEWPTPAEPGSPEARAALERGRAERAEVERARVPVGAALLDGLLALVTRYVVLPSAEVADAVCLWVAATHALESFTHATRLVIRSPEKRCGKSRLLDVIAGTCHTPLVTVNATVAAIFRSLGPNPPTLLVDEADSIFGSKKSAENNEDLRGLLNAGFQRGRPMLRCVGPMQEPTNFETFAMVALAGIGSMPDTIEDRAVIVSMRRRAPDEPVQPYRQRRDGPELAAMRERLAEWATAHLGALEDAEPQMPVEDRAADTWEPLVAIADAAGGTWPARARAACLALTTEADQDATEASLGIRLLADVVNVLDVPMSSSQLVIALREIDEAPWEAFGLDQRGLARRLKGYGITPRPLPRGRDEKQVRGYTPEQFTDARSRYLPAPAVGPSHTVTPSHEPRSRRSDTVSGVTLPERVTDASVTPDQTVTPESAADLGKRPPCDGVTQCDGDPPGKVCRACGEPMTDLGDGATTHPTCDQTDGAP